MSALTERLRSLSRYCVIKPLKGVDKVMYGMTHGTSTDASRKIEAKHGIKLRWYFKCITKKEQGIYEVMKIDNNMQN